MATTYRITLSYHGAAYAGWQRQTNASTVQQEVERALSDLLGEGITVHGAGRTDTGVHARGQVAHFELSRRFPLDGLVHGGNHRLPRDIRLLRADRMSDGFHARKLTVSKEYRYRWFRGRVVPPLDAAFCTQVPSSLDTEPMRQALVHLPGRHDFTAFALAGGSHTQPFRRLFKASLEEDGRYVEMRLVGDGFLRGMVRSLAGTLVQVGMAQRSTQSLAELLQGRPRCAAGPTAAAHGLVLFRVDYGPENAALDTYST